MEIIFEFLLFLKSRKRYWLIPLFVILFLLGFLLVLAQASALAPFIYTLF
ncbi:DUF5989 family protein [Mucilaginibacter sabulilitoris]|uniref:DUF5989 family protein n=1 Tax=Mucilaginibacter sabulilitoris TaxID=1173583 RepID=A0ABZ0TJ51_9SPHI|nr:DUF5989 family protein [Mucilaginibacter sabulilitoris]WPU92223.1 DUF5989 family protein [Mucilaginibacter sabulilitoris]